LAIFNCLKKKTAVSFNWTTNHVKLQSKYVCSSTVHCRKIKQKRLKTENYLCIKYRILMQCLFVNILKFHALFMSPKIFDKVLFNGLLEKLSKHVSVDFIRLLLYWSKKLYAYITCIFMCIVSCLLVIVSYQKWRSKINIHRKP